MPRLNKVTAKKVDDATGSFEPVPEGRYLSRLRGVEVKEGPKGPYWTWEYEAVEGEYAGRRFWNNTSLSESSLGFMKATFQAFGVPTSTDTDEMCGSLVNLIIGKRVIQAGTRKGELTNSVERILAADSNGESAPDDDESIFS